MSPYNPWHHLAPKTVIGNQPQHSPAGHAVGEKMGTGHCPTSFPAQDSLNRAGAGKAWLWEVGNEAVLGIQKSSPSHLSNVFSLTVPVSLLTKALKCQINMKHH
jgi:hypothetical protein